MAQSEKENRKIVSEAWVQERIQSGRALFGNATVSPDGAYETDQDKRLPQPPLFKAPVSDQLIDLPSDFTTLDIDGDFLGIINCRKSHRVYTDQAISLTALAYLLWCTQGVKSVRGKAYATLRTVPGGGARHPFECYMAIRKVEGLKSGLYHYLPMKHQLEYLGDCEEMEEMIGRTLQSQKWAEKASVVFYYSCVFYRAEWRYGIWTHPTVLIDSGHVTENLYLAATSIGLGGCAIAAVDGPDTNRVFSLDGKEETIFYAMPVGTVAEENQAEEEAFYAFVREQGL